MAQIESVIAVGSLAEITNVLENLKALDDGHGGVDTAAGASLAEVAVMAEKVAEAECKATQMRRDLRVCAMKALHALRERYTPAQIEEATGYTCRPSKT